MTRVEQMQRQLIGIAKAALELSCLVIDERLDLKHKRDLPKLGELAYATIWELAQAGLPTNIALASGTFFKDQGILIDGFDTFDELQSFIYENTNETRSEDIVDAARIVWNRHAKGTGKPQNHGW
jgi:hypothetical protein